MREQTSLIEELKADLAAVISLVEELVLHPPAPGELAFLPEQ